MKTSMGCFKAVTALACAGASMSAGAVAIDFADIMNGDTDGATYSVDGGPALDPRTETYADKATFTQGSVSIDFTAGDGRFVYLDARPNDPNADYGGSGIGVCGEKTTSCGAEDEVGIVGNNEQEVLFADFGKVVSIEALLFSEENNLPPISDEIAKDLVQISLDGEWENFVGGKRYTAQKFGFRVNDTAGDLNLAQGNEFYLRGLSVVPLPAAAWLFGSMLLALGGFNYRRRGLQAA